MNKACCISSWALPIKAFYATLCSSRIFTHGGAPQTFSSLKIYLSYCHFHRNYAHLFLFTYIIIIIIIPDIFIIKSDINLYVLPRSTTMQNLEIVALKLAELLQFQKLSTGWGGYHKSYILTYISAGRG